MLPRPVLLKSEKDVSGALSQKEQSSRLRDAPR